MSGIVVVVDVAGRRHQVIGRMAAMIERFNRLFVRDLRALRDLRRVAVVVGNAGQVNVAENQVNVST
jgi:hypothetical protein